MKLTNDGVTGWFQPQPGKGIRLVVTGNAGGGTVTYERSYDGGVTAVTQTGGGSAYPSFTAASDEIVDMCEVTGVLVRARLTGSAGPNVDIMLGHY